MPHLQSSTDARDHKFVIVSLYTTHFFRKRNTPLFPNTKLAWPDTDTEIPANENFFRIKNKTTETFYVVTVTVIRLTGSLIWADEKGQGALDCSDLSVDKQTKENTKYKSVEKGHRSRWVGGCEPQEVSSTARNRERQKAMEPIENIWQHLLQI